jgi:hypothetical protein
MNPQDLLKQAASNLRQAAQARQQEVKDLESTLMQRLKDQENHLNDLKQQEALRLSEAAGADDNRTTASRNQEARMLRTQESQVKSTHDQMKRDTDQLIKVKRQNIDDINRTAQNVEQWSQL